jgi:hypothetical protein
MVPGLLLRVNLFPPRVIVEETSKSESLRKNNVLKASKASYIVVRIYVYI